MRYLNLFALMLLATAMTMCHYAPAYAQHQPIVVVDTTTGTVQTCFRQGQLVSCY